MIKFFSMNNKIYNVRIDKDEVLRYLGYTRPRVLYTDNTFEHDISDGDGVRNIDHSYYSLDTAVNLQIDDCIKKIASAAEPKYVYRLFELERISECENDIKSSMDNGDKISKIPAAPYREKIMLGGTSVEIPGNDADALLRDCNECIIMAATLGQKSEMLLRRTQITDMTEAVILDCCASSAIESICEQINDDLRCEYETAGKFLTDRYSPGYGDMPLTLQTELCELLQTEKRIGLSVSPGLMLIPSKSVTAIIGISDTPQGMREISCDSCRLHDTCKIREAGGCCGKSR